MAALGDDAGLFDGPGKVRERLRAVPWSQTPLGPVGSWSPVLRTMLRGALASRFPIAIHWGPARVALYNDAFVPLIAAKHPAALARPAQDTWPEAWDVVGARLDEVITGGRTVAAEDEQRVLFRNGYPEECYFSLSHSPIEDLDGNRVGVFTIAVETTAKVLYQRRMRVVQDLGAVSSTGAGGAAETCRAVLEVLVTARETMPFAVAFLREGDTAPQLVADYGLASRDTVPASDDRSLGGSRAGSLDAAALIQRVLTTGRTEEVDGLRAAFPGVLLPGPLGPLTPDAAVIMPLTVSGRPDPIGVLAIGVNPYRPLTDEYRAFFRLVGRQVRVALGDTVAYQVQRLRGQVLADLDHAKTEFFQNVSHELRTPLTVLLAPLQNLLATAEDRPAAEQQDLQAALRAAQRLNTMVDALLDFTGAEARTLRPDRQLTDLNVLTAQTASMFRAAAEHAGLTFQVRVPDRPITVAVDRGMWTTIVTNLVSNAVKYTVAGGISISTHVTEAAAVLTVTDTGPGIEPSEQALVFDRFHRAPGAGQSGAGIGLSVVADLVKSLQGRIEVTSTPGRGTTFTVTLPVATTDPPPMAATPAPDTKDTVNRTAETAIDEATGGAGNPVVVLVEDDTDLREFLVRLLTGDGWQVHAYSTAETAVEQLLDSTPGQRPDLVITDVMLPGRDGLSLVRQLRQHSTTSRTPMIILTARHGDDATAEGLQAGADDYITKPFSSQELLARAHANQQLARLREDAVDDARTRGDNLRIGLDSSRTIGTAIGILMTNHRLTAAAAFRLLTAVSQHTNRKLRDIAADVATTGQLPVRPTLTDDLLIRVTTPPDRP
jgi:signal transduction histidine kinase/DNA-binding response OmpR family regulator